METGKDVINTERIPLSGQKADAITLKENDDGPSMMKLFKAQKLRLGAAVFFSMGCGGLFATAYYFFYTLMNTLAIPDKVTMSAGVRQYVLYLTGMTIAFSICDFTKE